MPNGGAVEALTPPPPAGARRALGRQVQALRMIRGWRQEDLALATGLHRTYIGSLERGERNVSLDNLVRLAQAFDLSLAELLESV